MSNSHKYDLCSSNFIANPHTTYEAMRQHAPLYLDDTFEDTPMWLVTRYEDVATVMTDTKRFAHNYRDTVLTDEERAQQATQPELAKLITNHMLISDPPKHTRLRSLVSKAFTPRMFNSMHQPVTQLAHTLIDKVEAQGEMDLVEDYAYPLPLTIIAQLLGIPPKDNNQFRIWSDAFIHPHSREGTKQLMIAFINYLRHMFDKRRQAPQDDLITRLVQAEEAGDKLSENELISMIILLLAAGHETTVNLISNGTLTLLQHPEQLAQLKQNPALFETAIEEMLRYEGPVERATSRWTTEEVVLGGCTIPRGQRLRVVLSSANRDPAQFDNPHTFNITRQHNRHIAFGRGIHYCLGAPLARIEGRIAIQTLFDRLPSLRLKVPVDTLEWIDHRLMRGVKMMPVAWDSPTSS